MKEDIGVLERLVGRPALQVEARTVLTREGEIGDHLAVVLEGRVAVQVAGHDLCVLGPGETVGDAAAVQEPARHGTAKALTPVTLLMVSVDAFDRLRNEGEGFARELELAALGTEARMLSALDASLLHHHRDYAPEWEPERETLYERVGRWLGVRWRPAERISAVEALRQSELIGDLLPENLPVLTALLRARRVSPGHVFFAQGEAPADLHVLVSGALEALVTHEGQVERLGTIEPGEVFGVTSLLEGRPHLATCVATKPSVVVKLDADAFEKLVVAPSQAGNALRSAVLRSLARTVARASDLLAHRLSEEQGENTPAAPSTPVRARAGFRRSLAKPRDAETPPSPQRPT